MLVVAIAIAVGVGISRAAPSVSSSMWAGVAAIIALSLAAHRIRTRGRLVTLRPFALAAAVVGLAVTVGAMRDAEWRSAPANDVSHVAGLVLEDEVPVALLGTVVDVPERTDWSVRFVLEADSAERLDRQVAVSGRVQATLYHNDATAVYPLLRQGDTVSLEGRLEERPRRRNPAQMDYGRYLENLGIGATLTVEDESRVAFLRPSRRLDHRLAESVRTRVQRTLSRTVLEDEPRALLSALILADRSAIEDETLDAFRSTGLMHLLAVSGLHVGLVGLVVYGLLKPILGRFRVRRRRLEVVRAVITLGLLAVYVLVSGASVSVVRAFVMVSALIVGSAMERRRDTLNALGLAAIVLLLHRPSALFEVGFQLSFGAVFAIVTLTPLLTSRVPDRVRQSATGTAIVGSMATTIAATIGTAPALLTHFGRLPIGGLVLNLPAIPLTAATLASGLGSVVLSPFETASRTMGALANVTGNWLIALTETGAGIVGHVAYSAFWDDPFTIVASVLIVGALALWRRPVARRRVGMAAVACIAVGLWDGVLEGESVPDLEVVFLDVGQGDATLVSTPDGSHVLIDAGIKSPFTDQGERTVVPHLERYGVRRLDALVLTHADADHIGGARSVLEAVEVGQLIVNGAEGESDLWDSLMRAADSLGVPVQPIEAGDALEVDPSVRIRALGPNGSSSGSANDASIALLVEHGETRWLLTGDAEVAGEAALVSAYASVLEADVVKVGHHGSKTSSTPAFVEAVGEPAFAVVSVARRNRYGLPNDEPLDRWRSAGADVLLTSLEGAIWLRSDGETVERVEWRD